MHAFLHQQPRKPMDADNLALPSNLLLHELRQLRLFYSPIGCGCSFHIRQCNHPTCLFACASPCQQHIGGQFVLHCTGVERGVHLSHFVEKFMSTHPIFAFQVCQEKLHIVLAKVLNPFHTFHDRGRRTYPPGLIFEPKLVHNMSVYPDISITMRHTT